MPQEPHAPSRFDALTGIRAFAAAWVVSFHYILGPFGALGGPHVSQFVDVGYLGVDLFSFSAVSSSGTSMPRRWRDRLREGSPAS